MRRVLTVALLLSAFGVAVACNVFGNLGKKGKKQTTSEKITKVMKERQKKSKR